MAKKDNYNNKKIKIHTVTSQSLRLGILLALVGGFLDSYTFITRNGVFANAQTGNIVMVGVEASQGNWGQAVLHIPPIIAFILGVVVVEKIKGISLPRGIQDTERSILVLEILTLFLVGFIPTSVPDIIITVIISFVASLQVQSFRKLVGSPYNTAMCTGNLRTASQTAYEALKSRDRKAAIKAIRYSIIIGSFLIGAIVGGVVTLRVGVKGVWGADIILVLAFILFNFDDYRLKTGTMVARTSD
ncbi:MULTISPECIES: YoaK family protein [Clostridium]|uniref:DUF1275 domain-containing protein n=1 Tax=Clostridium cibarium TaxID=2762247 RepID=A0ABR8PUJ0_9CLOT|nr:MULTISPECIES: YoaK family protein [Clostridium]MBD7911847.1 DUF1275 domain-containing protein [Clostridium cibarium]